jgi:hypothetical protein
MKHVRVKNLLDPQPVCGRCGEPWPCLIARSTEAGLALLRKEITPDEMKRRIMQPKGDS